MRLKLSVMVFEIRLCGFGKVIEIFIEEFLRSPLC